MAIDASQFRIGVNYLPPDRAMNWLDHYDPVATRAHLHLAATAGFDSVRVFLPWDGAQPSPWAIDAGRLRHLVDTADAAAEAGVELVVTLFVGHMSGVNWIPPWATGGGGGDRRFRVIAGGVVQEPGSGMRNWYTDPEVTAAQEHLAAAAAGALSGHPALWAWDLGNENSNCTRPPNRVSGATWLERITGAIRRADPGRAITVGLHMEDLEEDRRLGPAEAARHCDFVCMHGYPIYASWAEGPEDSGLLGFLALVTRWLAGGAPVLFEEFGLPTGAGSAPAPLSALLVSEPAAAIYTGDALDALRAAGCLGAFVWCFSDYDDALFGLPPFDRALHERSFGLWRSDGSAKPALAKVSARVGRAVVDPPVTDWLDIDTEAYWAAPRRQLERLYRRYRATAARRS
ncbi:MAG: glycoside hydrolase 5 family protein [Actinomycetota bacterium]